MKILSTVSLFIFGVVLTSVLTAGLVFYQNNKSSQVADYQVGSLAQGTINQLTSSGKTLILDMAEISKHNTQSSCWMLIDGKVYDVTAYFGLHPGGNSPMAATCGTDATIAYSTQDPYASSNKGGKDHSSDAKNLLKDYYLGTLNQTIGIQNTQADTTTPAVDNAIPSAKPITVSPNVVKPVAPLVGNVTLNTAEISKHNKATDCWFIISGKVYNVTSYFGSHPGGNSPIAATCGEDATAEYATQNSSATTSSGSQAHSSNATSMLANYFIGNLNQVIGQQVITQTNEIVTPTRGGGDDEDDD
jgi:cytochrome b involved in lipid metabolism